ncbi:MAG: histidine triad nucleotide-binding protein [Clostridiales bacterium]|nr:histidine triad nucleotide-binding protein [Clostridiales bacterium]
MNDCLFCKIAAGQIPSSKVYEDDLVFAFRDIAPQAKAHILVIPKKHVQDLTAAVQEDDALLSHLMRTAAKVAELEGIAKTGYRVVSNCGSDGCQSVPHLHLHVLGGEKLSEKMA